MLRPLESRLIMWNGFGAPQGMGPCQPPFGFAPPMAPQPMGFPAMNYGMATPFMSGPGAPPGGDYGRPPQGHGYGNSRRQPVVCYKCDEPGHIATRCPYAAHQDAHQQQERPRPQQQQASRGTGTNSSQQGFVQLTMEQYDELRRNAEKAAALEEQCQKVQAQTQ